MSCCSGILRQYALQYVPSFIGTYLYALSKKQQKSVAVFEIFFLAIYNEEILECGPQSDNVTKKVRAESYSPLFSRISRCIKDMNRLPIWLFQ